MALVPLLQTGRVAAEATAERLQALGIDAQVVDQPNLFVRLASGGNYRVRVAVPEEELEPAREELARWEEEARPRVRALAGEVGRVLVLTAIPPLGLGLWLLTRPVVPIWGLAAVLGFWLGGLAAWVLFSRLKAAREGREGRP